MHLLLACAAPQWPQLSPASMFEFEEVAVRTATQKDAAQTCRVYSRTETWQHRNTFGDRSLPCQAPKSKSDDRHYRHFQTEHHGHGNKNTCLPVCQNAGARMPSFAKAPQARTSRYDSFQANSRRLFPSNVFFQQV